MKVIKEYEATVCDKCGEPSSEQCLICGVDVCVECYVSLQLRGALPDLSKKPFSEGMDRYVLCLNHFDELMKFLRGEDR